jgi:MFS family permease
MVALWAWLADIANVAIRGRFFGWRERWLVAGQALSAIAVALFVWAFADVFPGRSAWIPYAIAGGLGAVCMLGSLVPLAQMPETASKVLRSQQIAWKDLVIPFVDRRFWGLLAFGCWFSFFNGITQSAQHFFPMTVLGISLSLALILQTGMRLGQLGISPRVGQWADRWGNRPVMIVSQLLVAAGLLCFAVATPDHWGWVCGAWILWIAYAGINVCLPHWLLKLSPTQRNVPYIATFYALTGLCYAASTLAGGAIVDRFGTWHGQFAGVAWSFFSCFFLAGWLARSLGAILLWFVAEPSKKEAGRQDSPAKTAENA